MHDGREFFSTTQGSSGQERTPTQARPLRLPHLTSAWARWCTAVFGAGLQFSVNVGGRVWTWKPVWHNAWQRPAPTHWACTLHGSAGGQPFTCWLDSLAPLAVPPLGEDDLALLSEPPLSEAPLPEALLAAVMQDVTAASLTRLGAALGQQVTLKSLRYAPEEALLLEESLPFTLTLADEECAPPAMPTRVNGLLAAAWPHPFFAALYQAAEQESARKAPALPHWPLLCTLPCPVVWRTRPLTLADIRTLEVGDVLLMPRMTDGDAGMLPVHMQVGRAGETGRSQNFFAARWCVAQRTVTLESAMQQDRTDYEENASADRADRAGVAGGPNAQDAQEDAAAHRDDPISPAAPVASATWDQCRVPVQCRLGEVSVSLAELSTLAPGAVLHALDSVEAPVSLWLGATRIGRGALVDVNGRIGVRITEIIPAAHRE